MPTLLQKIGQHLSRYFDVPLKALPLISVKYTPGIELFIVINILGALLFSLHQ